MYMYLYLALAEKINFPYKQQFVKMMFTKILCLRNGKFHRVWCLISALILSTSVVRNYLAEPVVLFIKIIKYHNSTKYSFFKDMSPLVYHY